MNAERKPGISPNAALSMAAAFSGAAIIIHATVWTRTFAIILGATAEVAWASVAATLAGLALGAYLVGSLADRRERVEGALVLVEAGVAVVAGAVGFLLHLGAGSLTAVLYTPWAPRALTAFLTILVLVILPTILMGAALVLRITAGRRSLGPIRALAQLHGASAMGAAIGAFLCGFILLRLFGVTGTIGFAALLNLASGAVCAPLALGSGLPRAVTPREPVSSGGFPEWLLRCVALITGAMIMVLVAAWSRFAAIILGDRPFAAAILYACLLILLAVGAWLSKPVWERFAARGPDLFGWALVIAGATIAISTAAVSRWIAIQGNVEASWPDTEHLFLFYRVLETTALLAPPMIVLGCLFPLAATCSLQSSNGPGRTTGTLYLATIGGASAGAALVGLFGLSTVGAFGSVRAAVAMGSATALVIFGWCSRRAATGRKAQGASGFGMVGATLVAGLAFALVPSEITLSQPDEELLARREDANGIFRAVRSPEGRIRVFQNRIARDESPDAVATSFEQEMRGHLGMFFHPRAETAAIIGSGYGITAGALALYPQIERIDAVELLPGMVAAADLFAVANHQYYQQAKVRVLTDDGRHFLARNDQRYDIIVIDSNPRLAGEANLFHADFYDIARRRLTPNGVLIQHVFGSELAVQVRTLARSFPDMRLFPCHGDDFNIVAADHPLETEPEEIERLLAEPRVGETLRKIGFIEPISLPLVITRGRRLEQYPGLNRPGPIATDNHPRLEFAWTDDPTRLLISDR